MSGNHVKVRGMGAVRKHIGGRKKRVVDILRPNNQAERAKAALAHRNQIIASLSYKDRDALATIDDDPNLFNTLPPGDEGFDISHEGGEHEVYEGIASEFTVKSEAQRADNRDRTSRVEQRTQDWHLQLGPLVNAYLEYGLHEDAEMKSAIPDPDEPSRTFELDVVDSFYFKRRSFSERPDDIWVNTTLLRHGYLASAPLHPTIAISIRTLAAYRQAHRCNPRVSIQTEVRKLCHMHRTPYRAYLAEQFSIAYDVYLEINHRVDELIHTALDRDSENWRIRHACPACFYKLENEVKLKHSFFCQMDGNNSLKRTNATVREVTERLDTRRSRSDYWLTPEEVDRFAGEVKTKAKTVADEEDGPWQDLPANDPRHVCVQRWKNAAPEQRKQMWQMFDETGLFVIACRHGFILKICDMIRSGELAKYPLALVNAVLDIFGADIGCGYDIGCTFRSTILGSRIGLKAQALNLRMIVGWFHGHAHNRGCQVAYHPLYIPDMGRTDFEGCERIFSASNLVATATRHASKFHRHQAIEEHFRFWDDDKYAALSVFMHKHYSDALDYIAINEPELAKLKMQLGIQDSDFERYLEEEKAYLNSLRQEDALDGVHCDYVEALDLLTRYQAEFMNVSGAVQALLHAPAHSGTWAEVRNTNNLLALALRKVHDTEERIGQMEVQLRITSRWEVGSEEYKTVKTKIAERGYQRAIDELERLMVQRLFELSKLNVMGTGYRLRQRIAKALHKRSEAVRRALTQYNEQAQKLSPPRPTIDWKQLIEYSFLSEFDLLRYSRNDIRSKDWAQPSHREATVKYLQIQRSKEEIVRLNVEVPRLRTWIHDETILVENTLKELHPRNPPLAVQLRNWWKLRHTVNCVHIGRLNTIENLVGFSGKRGVGRVWDNESNARYVDEILAGRLDALAIGDDEESRAREFEGVMTFVENIVD